MLTLVLVLACVACGAHMWFRRNSKHEPPAFNGALPLIGHAHLLIGDCRQLWIFLKEVAYDCLKAGGVFAAYIGPKTVYFVSDPDDFLKIADTCLEKDNFYKFAKSWLGNGLVTSELPIWQIHRSLLDSAFSQTVLDGYLDVFNAQARRLVKELAAEVGKGPFDHLVYTRKNVLETTCLTVLGEALSEESVISRNYAEAIDEMFNILVQRFQRPWLYCDFLYSWTALKRRQDQCLKILHNVSETILKKRKVDYLNSIKSKDVEEKSNEPKFKPYMDLLIELAMDKGAFTDREIRGHVDTLMFGAHDAGAIVLACAMVLVGTYPEVQEKIFEELHGVFSDDDRDVTKRDLSQLVYLEAVIKESMRIYPVMPLTTRHLDKDVKLRNCTLKKGRTCFLFIFGVHRHPMWGPDAEKFKPERWLEPASMLTCPNAFAGFGMGRRDCIGKTHALMSLKTTLAHVFRHYRVSGNHSLMAAKIDVMLRPVSGHHISIENKKKNYKIF